VERLPATEPDAKTDVKFDQTPLEEKYKELYQQREIVQARMNAIRGKLTAQEYQALVRKIENPQLAKLKMPEENH